MARTSHALERGILGKSYSLNDWGSWKVLWSGQPEHPVLGDWTENGFSSPGSWPMLIHRDWMLMSQNILPGSSGVAGSQVIVVPANTFCPDFQGPVSAQCHMATKTRVSTVARVVFSLLLIVNQSLCITGWRSEWGGPRVREHNPGLMCGTAI